MGSALGLLTSLATGQESTWGTAVTPDVFVQPNTEGLEEKKDVRQSSALPGSGIHTRRGARRVVTARWGEGPVELEVTTNKMGRLLRHALGGTPTIAQQGGTAAYLQTHSLGSTLGLGLTVQKQIRDEADTLLQKYTMAGTKITAVEFKLDNRGMLVMVVTFDSKTFESSTAAATRVFTTTKTFHFAQCAITLGGVAATLIDSFSVKFDRKMKTDRFFAGSAGRKSEQLLNDFPDITGTLNAEFADPAVIVADFIADTPKALVMEFIGDLIASTFYETFRITIPAAYFMGETPKTSGPGLLMINAPFEGQYDGTNADLKIEYMSTDTTIT
jgi:hypothetical protein